jgi:hypothetical protein
MAFRQRPNGILYIITVAAPAPDPDRPITSPGSRLRRSCERRLLVHLATSRAAPDLKQIPSRRGA